MAPMLTLLALALYLGLLAELARDCLLRGDATGRRWPTAMRVVLGGLAVPLVLVLGLLVLGSSLGS
jgi:hypothetical protein